ncbi:energy-coupling factor ABC transporter ATP-binding protein [Anaerosinus massiliensis]|uniref:energy-coupling factor ABC transporter ATP-binding protein n=1 Tax=Massilibacillus massiliensis TaxID=1806837 RepID=UPI000ACB440A|nr:ABC transporter ATP-binding protein [Massilibacillus massiliensis]
MENKNSHESSLRWITITTLLLTIGVILRMISPSVGAISLNWNIVMYCLAIMLCRPNAKQGLGIGLVAGIVATMTSKAALPYANLMSEPIAGYLCAYMANKRIFDFKIRGISLEPAFIVLITTLVSGGIFVTVTKILINLPLNIYLYVMLPTVGIMAILGMVIGQLLYKPAERIFNNMKKMSSYTLKNMNLTVAKGSFTVITGMNGSGKTTLLLAISGGRMDYFSGMQNSRLIVNDIDICNTNLADLNHQVGMVFADYEAQLVTETVGDEIAFSLENLGLDHEEILRKRSRVLEMVGLTGLENRFISTLSGGQKQRLAIAVVLAVDSPILVLDEPIAAIDPEGAIEIYKLLKDLNIKYNKTIIVAEHDLKYIYDCVTQLVVLDDGTLKFSGGIEEGLGYMYTSKIYAEAVPLRWKIYLELSDKRC